VPVALARRPEELLARARRLALAIGPDLAEAVASEGRVGGGGAPGVPLPSAAVALPHALSAVLRAGDPPVVGHVRDGRLLLDLLTVPEGLDEVLVEAVRRAVDEERTA
jgi:L-seryl-tRNA(Ser) seleniumtransferase